MYFFYKSFSWCTIVRHHETLPMFVGLGQLGASRPSEVETCYWWKWICHVLSLYGWVTWLKWLFKMNPVLSICNLRTVWQPSWSLPGSHWFCKRNQQNVSFASLGGISPGSTSFGTQTCCLLPFNYSLIEILFCQVQVPFKTYFDVDQLSKFHRVVTMEDFFDSGLADKIWPEVQ